MRPRHQPKSREQLRRSLAERAANRRASTAGKPLPHPNLWDAVDPTKVDPGASAEAIHASALAFRALCPPRPRKKHYL